MKTLLASILAFLAAFLAGCANNVGKSVIVKSTVAGLDVSPGTPNAPGIRFGLVRNFYVAVPTNATLSSDVDASIGGVKETVREKIAIGVPISPIRYPHTNAHEAAITNTVRVR